MGGGEENDTRRERKAGYWQVLAIRVLRSRPIGVWPAQPRSLASGYGRGHGDGGEHSPQRSSQTAIALPHAAA